MGVKKYARINPEILIWARSTLPAHISIDDIAIRAGNNITADKITMWESGKELPSITEAKALAKIYDIPFAALYLSAIPKTYKPIYTDRRTINDVLVTEMSYELWKEIRNFISMRESLLLLDDGGEYMPLPKMNDNATVADTAHRIRTHFNIRTPFKYKKEYKPNAFSYFRTLFENMGILVFQIENVPVEEIRGISLYYDILPIIAVNKNDSERAKVFSLFHELAHLIRRSSALCLVDFDDHSDKEEQLCNKIAVEVLIPEYEFIKIQSEFANDIGEWDSLSLNKLADKYGVSVLVILRRLQELSVISYSYFTDLYNKQLVEMHMAEEYSKGKRNSAIIPFHYRYLNSTGDLFPKTILQAHIDRKISLGEACRILNVNVSHIEAIERTVMR